jgi:chemotaxis protein methyltransferase CheR
LIANEVLPCLAGYAIDSESRTISCLSLGCASGEEVYTLKLLWQELLHSRYSSLTLRIIALDADENMLARARLGRYTRGSVRELPPDLLDRGFVKLGGAYQLRESYRDSIEFMKADVRDALPRGPFHLVLCRNLVFTYFDDALQREITARITDVMAAGGFLAVGRHETVPAGIGGLTPYPSSWMLYQK